MFNKTIKLDQHQKQKILKLKQPSKVLLHWSICQKIQLNLISQPSINKIHPIPREKNSYKLKKEKEATWEYVILETFD